MTGPQQITSAIRLAAADPRATGDVLAFGLDALPALAGQLVRDQPIREAEQYEALLKSVLAHAFARGVDGPQARRIAAFQQQIGLLLKYKSYAVKAASPLGYAVFLQNPGEGFSFQEHITHKVEVFHIVRPHPGGYVFLCDIGEWNETYDPDTFGAWLRGGKDPRYERFRHAARPGDVFVIDRLRTVHTVMGCVLEEFATVSTDMVNRLHDQNAGRTAPERFHRAWALEQLQAVAPPGARREVLFGDRGAGENPLAPEPMEGGTATRLACGAIRITWYDVTPGARTDLFHAGGDAVSLYVTAGRGALVLCDASEAGAGQPPALAARQGDLFLIAPGSRYGFVTDQGQSMAVSEHKLPHTVAFVQG